MTDLGHFRFDDLLFFFGRSGEVSEGSEGLVGEVESISPLATDGMMLKRGAEWEEKRMSSEEAERREKSGLPVARDRGRDRMRTRVDEVM